MVSLILIHWIVIYPVDRAIQLLNNWGQANNCVRGTRTQPLICVGCSVHYWVSYAINKGGFCEIAFVVVVVVTQGNLRTTTTTLSTTTGSELQCTAQARSVNFVVVVSSTTPTKVESRRPAIHKLRQV